MINNRNEFWIKTAVGSESPIQLNPLWDYQEIYHKNKIFQNTQGGQLNIGTHVGSYHEFLLSFDFVSSSDATIINSWWSTNTQVHFAINSSYFEDSVLFRISNTNIPFNKLIQGRSDFYGMINLISIN